MKIIFTLISITISILLLLSCKGKEQPLKEPLTYLSEHTISVPEPSGLDITFNMNGFWTVSDETSTIYRLDTEGNVVQTIEVNGFDLEGVSVIDGTTLAVILERTREILVLDTSGNEIKRKRIPLSGEANSGLEGISYNQNNRHYYLLNERDPCLLLELNEELEVIRMDTLTFSKDVSGMYYDNSDNFLWILSDEDQLIVKSDLEGNLLEKIPITITQPEGITINKNLLYVVSDKAEKLYTFRIN